MKTNLDTIQRTVMVVEDEIINRQILGHILGEKYNVVYAENGVTALGILGQPNARVSLILLDLNMPEMDGYELMRVLRGDDALSKIPIIVMTSEKSAEVESLELGAVDFIPKPYDSPKVILARVDRSIALAERSTIINATERDELTGLYTREYFYEYCSKLDSYNPLIERDAIAADINHFNLIRELRGPEYCDRILKEIGDAIELIAKSYEGIACRDGLDKFCLYIKSGCDYDEMLDKILSGVKDEVGADKIYLRMGVYRNADKSIPPAIRFDRAFEAGIHMISSYRSGYAFYDTDLRRKKMYNRKLIGELDKAIEEKQFTVYYQPKYNITGDKPVLCSSEALVRWIHPEDGFLSPGVFIPLFEEHGLIDRIDRFVWRESAKFIRHIKDKLGVSLPVSVNVSRLDIFDDNLESELLKILGEASLEATDFLLEITESAYTDDTKRIISTASSLRQSGFRIEMDDFGSGFSSLNMLTSLPIDALKLDMKFVRNICTGPKDLRIVELVRDIARFLGFPVIAEGVETEEQYKLLKSIGIDIIQGYYFSKPLPAEEFEKLIEAEKIC